MKCLKYMLEVGKNNYVVVGLDIKKHAESIYWLQGKAP